MGTWGSRTFESDAASDFLDNLVGELTGFIESDLEKAQHDGILERPVIAAVVCLRGILSATLSRDAAAFLVPPENVEKWRAAFLDWFDRSASHLGVPNEVIESMRRIAESEFELLLDCVRD